VEVEERERPVPPPGKGGKGNSSTSVGSSSDVRVGLERQIERASRARGAADASSVDAASFAEDGGDGSGDCIKPASALETIPVCAGGGGGGLLADKGSRLLLGGEMAAAKLTQLKAARMALDKAKELVVRAVPSLGRLVADVVKDGYDGANDGYAGFCFGQLIVVNLFPMVKGLPAGKPLPADAVHELTLTLCHELAHLLERGEGHGMAHGAQWRATQDSLVQAVLLQSNRGASAAGGAPFGCQCCTRS
jgi:hypothetical protein